MNKETKLCLLNAAISLAIIGKAIEKMGVPDMYLDDLKTELDELTKRLDEIKDNP